MLNHAPIRPESKIGNELEKAEKTALSLVEKKMNQMKETLKKHPISFGKIRE
jgi:hypothetical protein